VSTSNWAWAAFVPRTILGLLVLFSGAHKAFQLGALLLVVLVLPSEADSLAMDRVLNND
jgi:hypothetical protein